MKKLLLNLALLFSIATVFAACGGEQKNESATEQTETNQEVAGVTYTCPMHPEVVSHEPGKCPKCGMNLEKVKPGDSQHEASEQH